jgi:hypothetical protein
MLTFISQKQKGEIQMSKKLVLTIAIAVLMITVPAMATDLTVNFNATNPNVTVTAYGGSANSLQWQGTAQFALTGTGSAYGTINANNAGVSGQSNTNYTGQPAVSGGYTASGGNFQSVFSASSYMTVDNCPKGNDYGHWSNHGINATGVTSGSMTVTGYATTAASPPPSTSWSFGDLVEGGQDFSGTAEEVTVYGEKLWATKKGDVAWDPTKFKGASFSATALGSSTVTFNGSTDAGTYPEGSEQGIGKVLSKQGLGFVIEITGSSLSGSLTTIYSYTNTQTEPDLIVGDTSTYFTGTSGGGFNQWKGVPGYLTNP